MKHLIQDFMGALRVAGATLAVCSGAYMLLLLGLGYCLVPWRAQGSLIRGPQGQVIGSQLIAQPFTGPQYVWPRPSAVHYDAAAAGGSNLSPAGDEFRRRVEAGMARLRTEDGQPVPLDLVTASGSGLDPDITLEAALFQARRIAAARNIAPERVERVIRGCAFRPGGFFTGAPLVNVLRVNLELDKIESQTKSGRG